MQGARRNRYGFIEGSKFHLPPPQPHLSIMANNIISLLEVMCWCHQAYQYLQNMRFAVTLPQNGDAIEGELKAYFN